MKQLHLMKMSLASLKHRKLIFLSIVVVNVVSFYMIWQGMADYQDCIYKITRVKEQVQGDRDRLFHITFHNQSEKESFTGNMNTFIEGLKEIPHIRGSGRFVNTADCFLEIMEEPEYLERNAQLYTGIDVDFPQISYILEMDQTMTSLCDKTGTVSEKLTKRSDGRIPVLVGWSYRDLLPVGTKLTRMMSKSKYIVVGALEKGSQWMPSGSLNIANYALNLDLYFVALLDEETIRIDPQMSVNYISNTFYTVEEKKYIKDVYQEVADLAEKYKLKVTVRSMNEELAVYKEENKNTIYTSLALMILTVLAGVISVSSAAIVTALYRKSEFGIMYANGFTPKDMVCIVLYENGLKLLIALLLAIWLHIRDISQYPDFFMEVKMAKEAVFYGTGIWMMIGTGIVIWVITTIMPIIVIWRMKPVELIGGAGE